MTIGQIRSTKDDRMSATDFHRRQENQFQRNSARWFRIRKKSDVNVWLHMDGETWTTADLCSKRTKGAATYTAVIR